jgi:acetoin utilization deacetylase AcuC-like enzyme
LRWHDPAYVEHIRTLSEDRGGEAGEATPFGAGSYEIACLAVGGCLAATEAVMRREVRNAYVLVRPPGHHAERDAGRGFCIFANIALSAMYAREVLGVERIAVVDWDVHHGNGTEHAFYNDPNVLTISVHQDNLYPLFSGSAEDRGSGDGEGANLNVPLPAGSGEGAYLAALRRVVLPALEAFRPEVVFLASGFDASAYDPLGRKLLTSESFRQMTRELLEIVDDLCDGRLVACHEGGYSSMYVPFCGLATIEELSGVRSSVADPFLPLVESIAGHELLPHQEAAIAAAETTARL